MNQTHFYATKEEQAQLQRWAIKQGLSLSAYVRSALGLPVVRRGKPGTNLSAPLPASLVQPTRQLVLALDVRDTVVEYD